MPSRTVDVTLLLTVLTLLGVGMVMVYSASAVEALVVYHSATYFLQRQLVWAGVGLTLMAVAARIDYHRWRRLAWPLFWVTLILLVAVLVPHIGREINGGRRWLGVGSLAFQPSELAKLSVVLLFAVTLTSKRFSPERFWEGLMPHVVALGVVAALIVKEPDLGTAIALGGTVFIMLFVAGARLDHLLYLVLVGVPVVLGAIFAEPYRRRRFLAFLHPQQDPLGAGYHIIQSLYALGSGGLFGSGLGRSSLKYFYLPEQHTDFIFAILGEELGFVGALAVLVLFFIFSWRGFRAALRAPDRFGAVLAVGLTSMVLLQALINVGVVTASMPITGIPLPFISYGGSSLVFALAGVGVLLNITAQAHRRL